MLNESTGNHFTGYRVNQALGESIPGFASEPNAEDRRCSDRLLVRIVKVTNFLGFDGLAIARSRRVFCLGKSLEEIGSDGFAFGFQDGEIVPKSVSADDAVDLNVQRWVNARRRNH